jgi:DNA polymerase
MKSLPLIDDHIIQEALEAGKEAAWQCYSCDLSNTRTNIVYGEGHHKADIMIIGEAPGYNEDQEGRPFIGRAGQLLDKMIKAMGYERSDVYITNTVKCRPPNNRDPASNEVESCRHFLQAQVATIRPKVILLTGLVASKCYFQQDKLKMRDIRGTWVDQEDVKVMPIYHPAALLRNPTLKKPTWDDLQKVMRYLNAEEKEEENTSSDPSKDSDASSS